MADASDKHDLTLPFAARRHALAEEIWALRKENGWLREEIAMRDVRLASAEEQKRLLFEAKNHWMARALQAEGTQYAP